MRGNEFDGGRERSLEPAVGTRRDHGAHQRSALIERDGPLERLEAGLAAARRERGMLLSVEGEAGVGKTAVVQALIDRNAGRARVHRGACEHFTSPEALGALRDIARESGGRFTLRNSGAYENFESLLHLLSHGAGPAILVIEDIHWADEGTLDLLRFLARRIQNRPILIIVTVRSDEEDSRGRIASFWSTIPRDAYDRIFLQPLSLQGVERLLQTPDAAQVHALTGGNPFFLTEYVAGGGGGVPRAVQDATLARLFGLEPDARNALVCASVFPGQIHEQILRELTSDPSQSAVESCLRSGMLQEARGGLRFRHELARLAIEQSIAPLRRRELHERILARLKNQASPRAAELLHHAEGARSAIDITRFAQDAANEARRLGAHREAADFLSKALDAGGELTDPQRAGMLEAQAEAAEAGGELANALAAADAAVALRRKLAAPAPLGNALRIAAKANWQVAAVDRADACAREALDLLQTQPDTWEYASALTVRCLLDMVAGRERQAIDHGQQAMRIAARLGRFDIYAYALVHSGVATCCIDLDTGLRQLREGVEEARRVGAHNELADLHAALIYVLAHKRDFEELDRVLTPGVEACRARDRWAQEVFIMGGWALSLCDRGRYSEAIEAVAPTMSGRAVGIMAIPAMLASARAELRSGGPFEELLTTVRAALPDRPDLLRLVPLAILDVEGSWLNDDNADAAERLSWAVAKVMEAWGESWALGDALFWLKVAGRPYVTSAAQLATLADHHRLFLEDRWRESAEAWERLGCPYEQAVALSHGDEPARRAALAIFDELGAAPAARKLRRDLRADGVRAVPAGPSKARRAHPAGLSYRQAQVLERMAEGLTNPEIAERMGLSAKTVEHHVSAVLAALEATNRMHAVNIARERGLLPS